LLDRGAAIDFCVLDEGGNSVTVASNARGKKLVPNAQKDVFVFMKVKTALKKEFIFKMGDYYESGPCRSVLLGFVVNDQAAVEAHVFLYNDVDRFAETVVYTPGQLINLIDRMPSVRLHSTEDLAPDDPQKKRHYKKIRGWTYNPKTSSNRLTVSECFVNCFEPKRKSNEVIVNVSSVKKPRGQKGTGGEQAKAPPKPRAQRKAAPPSPPPSEVDDMSLEDQPPPKRGRGRPPNPKKQNCVVALPIANPDAVALPIATRNAPVLGVEQQPNTPSCATNLRFMEKNAELNMAGMTLVSNALLQATSMGMQMYKSANNSTPQSRLDTPVHGGGITPQPITSGQSTLNLNEVMDRLSAFLTRWGKKGFDVEDLTPGDIIQESLDLLQDDELTQRCSELSGLKEKGNYIIAKAL
jgi:hypothetical protein